MFGLKRGSNKQLRPGPKTIKKRQNATQNKSQTQRARAYTVTSFLSTDCVLSTGHAKKTFIISGLGVVENTSMLRTI